MADIRKLKKHLGGIRATEKLASAMKTVSTAKFSKLTAMNNAFGEYFAECERLIQGFDASIFSGYGNAEGTAYLLFTGNKGLCGGYNSELIAYYNTLDKTNSTTVVCGKKGAELLGAKGVDFDYFEVNDLPTFESAAELLDKITPLLESHGQLTLVYRKFANALVYPIVTEPLIPSLDGATDDDSTLYIPSKQSIATPFARLYLTARLYGVMLQAATGAQAATLMTMRSAADNAKAEAAKTETAINRERQNALTASVIESAGGYAEHQ